MFAIFSLFRNPYGNEKYWETNLVVSRSKRTSKKYSTSDQKICHVIFVSFAYRSRSTKILCFSRLFFNSKNENWIKFLALYKFFCGKKYDQNEKNILEEKILVREKFQIFFNSCNEFFGLIYVHMWHVVTFFQFLVLLE